MSYKTTGRNYKIKNSNQFKQNPRSLQKGMFKLRANVHRANEKHLKSKLQQHKQRNNNSALTRNRRFLSYKQHKNSCTKILLNTTSYFSNYMH